MNALILSLFLFINIEGNEVYNSDEPIIYEEKGIEIKEYLDGDTLYANLTSDIEEDITCNLSVVTYDSNMKTSGIKLLEANFSNTNRNYIHKLNESDIAYYHINTNCYEKIINSYHEQINEKNNDNFPIVFALVMVIIALTFIITITYCIYYMMNPNKHKKFKKNITFEGVNKILKSNNFNYIGKGTDKVIDGKYTKHYTMSNKDNIVIDFYDFNDIHSICEYYYYVRDNMSKKDLVKSNSYSSDYYKVDIFIYKENGIYMLQNKKLFIYATCPNDKKDDLGKLLNDFII